MIEAFLYSKKRLIEIIEVIFNDSFHKFFTKPYSDIFLLKTRNCVLLQSFVLSMYCYYGLRNFIQEMKWIYLEEGQ